LYLSTNRKKSIHILPPGWSNMPFFFISNLRRTREKEAFSKKKMAGIMTRGITGRSVPFIFSRTDAPDLECPPNLY
jgi:hypothetical protein